MDVSHPAPTTCSHPRPVSGISTLALAIAISVAPALWADQPAIFHAETRLVVLDVSVTDRHGSVVTGLGRDAFRVSENGRSQRITILRSDDVPVSLGLIIDSSGSMRRSRAAVEAAAMAFVRASNVEDDLFVVNFADQPRLDVPLTRDVHVVEAGIARADPIGGTALRDAIVEAERYLRDHASHERRALLVITDGVDNASMSSPGELRRVVEGGGTVLHAVSFARTGQRGARNDESELTRLVELTGGTVNCVAGASEVESTVLSIARRIRSGYTIGYTPANQALDGSYRAVRVTVTRPRGLTARTRSGYWATPGNPVTRQPNVEQ